MEKLQVLYWSKDILYEQNEDHLTSGIYTLLTMVHFVVSLIHLYFKDLTLFPWKRVMIEHASQTCAKLQ